MQLSPFLRPIKATPPLSPNSTSTHRWTNLTAPLFAFAVLLCAAWKPAQAQGNASTATVLNVSAAGTGVTAVSPLTVVSLSAAVTSNGTPVTRGQVNFCDATALTCSDIHLIGSTQLTSAGAATLRVRPGIGVHQYKAVFAGTQTYGASASNASTLTVNGSYPTVTTLTDTGLYTNYTLTANVSGTYYGPMSPQLSGTVSLNDTTNGTVLGSPSLGTNSTSLTSLNVSNPPTVSEPNVVAAADFNGDGIPDLAVSNSNEGETSLTILLGKGDGTFTAAPSPQVGLYSDSIVVADFNGDGIPDIAITSVDQALVRILLGNGDGTFTAKSPDLIPKCTPQSLAVADFNHDGLPDLVLATECDAEVLLGKGDGSFQAPVAAQTAEYGFISVATGDLNADGNADIVLVGAGDSVTILLGAANGSFTSSSIPSVTGGSAWGVALGDFNGDGIPDLAVTNYEGTNAVAILLGKGDGTFGTPHPVSVPTFNSKSVLVADFNGDGKADLAVGEFWEEPPYILLGNGDGTFGAAKFLPSPYPLGSGYIAVADFDGDGIPDVAEPSQDVQGTVAVDLTRPTVTASATAPGITPTGPGPHQVTAAFAGNAQLLPSTSTAVSLAVQVAPPVVAPASGIYGKEQTLTITDSTPGASITYALFGASSTGGNVPYGGPVILSASGAEAVNAFATAPGYAQSDPVDVSWLLSYPAAATPVLSLASGTYSSAQTVTITDATPGATIYYSTDGVAPNTGSPVYTGPLTIASSEVLSVAAVAPGAGFGPTVTVRYLITSSPAALIYTVAGSEHSGYSGDGSLATAADLNRPGAVVVDAAGNLFIADTNNQVIRKVAAATGLISTYAGTGSAGYSGDGGPASKAQLSNPAALALDAAGNLFIADSFNDVIREVAAATGVITTFAGTGQEVSSGDGGPASAAGIGSPLGIAFDTAGDLYIASNFCGLRKVAAGTSTISTVAGNGSCGNSGDGGPALNAEITTGYGLAISPRGDLFFPDQTSVRKVDAQTGVISTVAGSASTGGYTGDGGPATAAELNVPEGLSVDAAGNLYIADYMNQAIREINAATGIITTVVGGNLLGFCALPEITGGDAGAATSAGLCYPSGVTVDSAGNLLIADSGSGRIREVKASAALPTASTATPVFSLTSGTYNGPQTLTITDATPGASIYVTLDGSAPTTLAQAYNGPIPLTGTVTAQAIAAAPGSLASAPVSATIQLATPPSTVITTVAGNGGTGYTGSGTPAIDSPLYHPLALGTDAKGNVYFADSQNTIWSLSASTGNLVVVAGNGTPGYSGDGGPATSAQLEGPGDIAVDASGNVYLSDPYASVVRRVDATTGTISIYAGVHQAGTYGDGGPATEARLSGPEGLAVDSAGNLYIADQASGRVRVVSAKTGIISTLAGNGSPIDSGDGGPATSAGIYNPTRLTVDSAQNLFITTELGHIRKVAAGTGVISTIAGNGNIEGGTGDGGPAINAEISPDSLAVDAKGNLYFSDFASNTIREVDAVSGNITSVVGTGYMGFGGDGGSATMAEFSNPEGIAFDVSGNLFIADSSNGRIRKVSQATQAPAPGFSPAAGTYATQQSVILTDTLANATIFYTTDGSVPTTNSAVYSDPIPVSQTETLQAMATAPGFLPSSVSSASFAIEVPAASPVFNLTSGTYTSAQTLTLSDSTPAATIHYTTDGSKPTASSAIYAGPITVGATETISAVATSNGFTQSAVSSITVTIQLPATPTVAVTPSQAAINATQSITFTVTLTGTADKPVPTGTVALSGGGYSAKNTLVAGSTTFTVPPGSLATGTDTLFAAYTPDAASVTLYGAAQQAATVTVTPLGNASATLSITPASQVVTNSQKVSLAITVGGATSGPVPGGFVTVHGGSFSGQQTLANGQASFSISAGTFPAGVTTLSVAYSGDGNYAPATQNASVTIASLVITSTAPAQVSPGAATTAAVALATGSGFSGDVNLTCTLTSAPANVQAAPSCTPTPVTLNVGAGGTAQASITFSTQAAASAALKANRRWAGQGEIVFATLLFSMGFRKRRRSLLVLCFGLCVMTLAGCGGGQIPGTSPPTPVPGTTPGSYVFTITGTAAANAIVSASTTVTLVVN